VLERASHHIDLQRAVAGEVLHVQAGATGARLGARAEGDIDDAVCLLLHFAGGALGAIQVAWTREGLDASFGLELVAADASLHLALDPEFALSGIAGGKRVDAAADRPPFERGIERFLDAVRAGEPGRVSCTPADAAATLAVRRPLPPLPAVVAAVARPAYVVVHPGASVPARAPRPEDAAAVVAELVARGRRVVVTGGPAERGLTCDVAGALAPDSVVDLGGRTDLSTLAAVLDAARCVVVGNTGPAHLAAAVGTPVVSLFAPVVPVERWAPWGVPVRILGDQTAACRGSGARECPIQGHPCLASVSAAQVADAVDDLTPPAPPTDQIPHGRSAVTA
jgi:hypothetical protein